MATLPPTKRRAIERMMHQAPLAFYGQVRRLDASTVASIPKEPNLAVVRVLDAFGFPPELQGFVGKDVTIRLRAGSRPKPKERIVFFATSWVYAEGIALVEVGRATGIADPHDVRRVFLEAKQARADAQLRERAEKASLIVAARALEVRPVARDPFPIGEHDPHWMEASLVVTKVVKGIRPRRHTTMLFPSSRDDMWAESPRPVVGKEAVFLLQRDQTERGQPQFRRRGLTALHPLDIQPFEELDRVRLAARAHTRREP